MYDKPRVATVLAPFSHAGEWHLTLAENELVLVMGEKVHCISGEICLLSTVLHEPNPCSPSPAHPLQPGWYLGARTPQPKFQGIFPASFVSQPVDVKELIHSPEVIK